MKPFWKTEKFQLRWKEPLGVIECPYAFRWVLIFFGYSIRIHHFLRSDDKRYLHDHAWWFFTCVLKGHYIDVSEKKVNGEILRRKELVMPFKPVYREAHHRHYVQIPKSGCWTILVTGQPSRKWGFWVDNKLKRPLKFFHKFGHPPCLEQ
jgi:hypothetical protein